MTTAGSAARLRMRLRRRRGEAGLPPARPMTDGSSATPTGSAPAGVLAYPLGRGAGPVPPAAAPGLRGVTRGAGLRLSPRALLIPCFLPGSPPAQLLGGVCRRGRGAPELRPWGKGGPGYGKISKPSANFNCPPSPCPLQLDPSASSDRTRLYLSDNTPTVTLLIKSPHTAVSDLAYAAGPQRVEPAMLQELKLQQRRRSEPWNRNLFGIYMYYVLVFAWRVLVLAGANRIFVMRTRHHNWA
ncbi:uncharacterized protein LOC128913487 [Rissa tridactyla]|uniref:uncharacterized protein LOC128913487 n=1 Tax=Rissa tridactyla TaxID=75485 RepID=UPI0023BA412C|nr:uncharacterized protein LOC128913487 [Rissa tridactyla]